MIVDDATAAFVSSADGALLVSGACKLAKADDVAPKAEATLALALGLSGEAVDLSLPDGCSFF